MGQSRLYADNIRPSACIGKGMLLNDVVPLHSVHTICEPLPHCDQAVIERASGMTHKVPRMPSERIEIAKDGKGIP